MTERVRLVVATANPDKEREIRAVLVTSGLGLELVDRPPGLGEVAETGETLEANARLKARAVTAATGLPALADDTGLGVDALGGAPGVRSARYAGESATYAENRSALLAALIDVPAARRTARFTTVALVAFPDGHEVVARGEVEGRIVDTPRGRHGFGYDPVFAPSEGDGRTFAEMTLDEKQAISHRGRALRALTCRLRDAVLPAEEE